MSTSSNTTLNITPLSDRIQTLEPKLRKLAKRFSVDEMDQEDIFSEIVEAILVKCKPEHSDSMILTKAKWVAFDHINKAKIYTKYVGSEEDVPANHSRIDSEDSNHDIEFECVDITQKLVEDIVVEKEVQTELADAVSKLSPALQLIVSLLKKGYSPVEIAKKRGISESAVSQSIKLLSKSLMDFNVKAS